MNEAIRDKAKHLYVYDHSEIDDICSLLSVQREELMFMVKEEGWETERILMLTSKSHQLRQLYNLLDKVNKKMTKEEDINPKDADLAVKYTGAIKNLETETGIQEIIEVAKMFLNWLKTRNKEFTRKAAAELNLFIKFKLKEHHL